MSGTNLTELDLAKISECVEYAYKHPYTFRRLIEGINPSVHNNHVVKLFSGLTAVFYICHETERGQAYRVLELTPEIPQIYLAPHYIERVAEPFGFPALNKCNFCSVHGSRLVPAYYKITCEKKKPRRFRGGAF